MNSFYDKADVLTIAGWKTSTNVGKSEVSTIIVFKMSGVDVTGSRGLKVNHGQVVLVRVDKFLKIHIYVNGVGTRGRGEGDKEDGTGNAGENPCFVHTLDPLQT